MGYGNSGNRNQGLNKVGATHVTSSMPHGPSTANYPRQQYGVGSTHYTQPNQPHVINNYVTYCPISLLFDTICPFKKLSVYFAFEQTNR